MRGRMVAADGRGFGGRRGPRIGGDHSPTHVAGEGNGCVTMELEHGKAAHVETETRRAWQCKALRTPVETQLDSKT